MSTPAKQHPDRPDAAGFVRAALAAALAQVQSHLAVLEGGGSDAETIHQLRVALRRLRTVLRECAGLAPGMRAEWDDPWPRPLRSWARCAMPIRWPMWCARCCRPPMRPCATGRRRRPCRRMQPLPCASRRSCTRWPRSRRWRRRRRQSHRPVLPTCPPQARASTWHGGWRACTARCCATAGTSTACRCRSSTACASGSSACAIWRTLHGNSRPECGPAKGPALCRGAGARPGRAGPAQRHGRGGRAFPCRGRARPARLVRRRLPAGPPGHQRAQQPPRAAGAGPGAGLLGWAIIRRWRTAAAPGPWRCAVAEGASCRSPARGSTGSRCAMPSRWPLAMPALPRNGQRNTTPHAGAPPTGCAPQATVSGRTWEGGDACCSAPTLRAAAFRKPGYRPSALLSDAAGVRLSGPAPACAGVAGSGVRAVRRGSDDRPHG